MRLLNLIVGFLLSVLFANAQSPIVITRADMPNVNDTFRFSTVDNLLGLVDLSDDGENQTWDYSTLGSFDQRLDTFVDPVFGTPLIYNVTFSNIFDIDYFATLAQRNTFGPFDQNFVAIENVFDFYRETNDYFANVGLGLTINGFPLTAKMQPRDKIYEFPLEYGDQDNSFAQYGVDVPQFGHFGQKIQRTNTVDAWGTISTRFGTFEAIRVTTSLIITDTISIQGFGFEQPRPEQFEVKWWAKNIGAPILTVRGQNLFGQQVINTVEYLDSIRGFTPSTFPPEPEDTTSNPTDTTAASIEDLMGIEEVSIQPNPFSESFDVWISANSNKRLNVVLFDITGKLVAEVGQFQLSPNANFINVNTSAFGLKPGMYQLVLSDDSGGRLVRKLIKKQ